MNVLILSPHTDDAELGSGGTIYKLLESQNDIYWLVFSIAEDSLPSDFPKDTLKNEFMNAIKEFNLDENNIQIFNFKVRYLFQFRQKILQILIDEDFEIPYLKPQKLSLS